MRIEGEDPWETLGTRTHLTLHVTRLPTGYRGLWLDDLIILDSRLTRTQRRCTLMHELIHAERGIATDDPVLMAREEAIVRRETARRLVPPDALAGWIVRRVEVQAITAACVAEAADVTLEVAAEALRQIPPSRAYRARERQ